MTGAPRTGVSRRRFLELLPIGAFGAITGAVVAMVGRFLVPHRRGVIPDRVVLGPRSSFPVGTVRDFPEHGLRLLSRESGLGAISLACSHLGCQVQTQSKGFFCACHASKFDDEGRPLSGPAPRPLTWYAVEVQKSGDVVVDLARAVEPGTYGVA